MSYGGLAWTAAPVKKYGSTSGSAHPSVEFVTCPTCGAKPGVLCVGFDGDPTLARHVERCRAYKEFRLALRRRPASLIPRAVLVRSLSTKPCGYRGCARPAHYTLVAVRQNGDNQEQLRCCFTCGHVVTRAIAS